MVKVELETITEINVEVNETEQHYLMRLLLKADSQFTQNTKLWEALTENSRKWFNEAVDAVEAKKPIPKFPDEIEVNTATQTNILSIISDKIDVKIPTQKIQDEKVEEGITKEVQELFAVSCIAGNYYEVIVAGNPIKVECIRNKGDEIIVEDESGQRFKFTPTIKVKLLDVPNRRIIAKPTTVEKSKERIEKPKKREKMGVTRFVRELLCKNPSLTKGEIYRMLDEHPDYKEMYKKETITSEFAFTSSVLDILKSLGALQYPCSESKEVIPIL